MQASWLQAAAVTLWGHRGAAGVSREACAVLEPVEHAAQLRLPKLPQDNVTFRKPSSTKRGQAGQERVSGRGARAPQLRLPRRRHATLAPGYRLGGRGTCGRGARAAAAGAGRARAAAQAAQAPPHPGLLDVQRAHKRCPPRAPARSAASPGSSLPSGLLRGQGERELAMGVPCTRK